jgi:hypothetical protein
MGQGDPGGQHQAGMIAGKFHDCRSASARARSCAASFFKAACRGWVKSGCEQVQKNLDNGVGQMRPWPPSSIPQIPFHQLPTPCCTAPFSSPRGRIGGPGWTAPGRSLSLTATDRLVHGYCNRFHPVSKRHETANTLIEIENYPPVSPFHDFRGRRPGI